MSPTEKKSSDNDYGKFLEGLRLIYLALRSCSAKLDRKAHWKVSQKGKRLNKDLNEGYKVLYIGENFFDLEGRFSVIVSDREGKSEVETLKLECTFDVHIHSDPPIVKEFVERFTQAELRLLLLPYARHFVTNITGQMDIRPVVIPLAIGRQEPQKRDKKE